MGLLLTTIAGLVIWIVLWAIGVKSFDAFMITVADDPDRGHRPRVRARPSRATAGEEEPRQRLDPTLTRALTQMIVASLPAR